jgi:hypothetical protein
MKIVFPVAMLVLLVVLPAAAIAETIGLLPASAFDLPAFVTAYVVVGMLALLGEDFRTQGRSARGRRARVKQPETSTHAAPAVDTSWVHQTAST